MFKGKKEKKEEKVKEEKKEKRVKDKSSKKESEAEDDSPRADPKPVVAETNGTAASGKDEEELKKREEERKKEEKKREEERIKAEKLKAAEKEKEKKKDIKPPPPPAFPQASNKKNDDGENVDAEVQSLESARLDSNDSSSSYKDLYHLLPEEVFVSYDKLQHFARDLNTQIPTPEFVIIGKKDHGKSSILDAFFGQPLNDVVPGGASKRPIYFNILNNADCKTPKCTVKRDSALRQFDHDVEVSPSELGAEISKRNQNASDDPIVVQYESQTVCNMTFIDTPGLLDRDGDVSKEDRENLVLSLARPNHRIILAVEAARDWSKMEMASFVKKVDPELSRTTFVYTKFHSLLQNFTSTREVNKFLSATLPDVKTFFVSLLSSGIRSRFSSEDKFQQKIFQSYRRDMNTLEQLQFDKRYEANVGIHALRKYLLNLTWKSYQESIPRILKQLRAKKLVTQKKIQTLEQQLEGLDPSKLRSIASSYVVNFLQIVERLIAGTSEGNPAVNGQTLEEEKNAHGDGDWVDIYNRVIRFEPEEWNVPYWDNKLYGGQQFERLLAEYRAVADHTEISEVTMDDVATAAGINKLNNIPNYSWAASDLAQQKSQEAFQPLIEQLTNRAVYIVKRLTDISEKVLEGRKKKWNGEPTDLAELERYPYFTYHVKDLFFKFVDQTAKQCKEKCLDEFYSTRTIYWDLTSEYADRRLPLERNDQEDTKTAVVSLSTDIFKELRDRITKNTLLKFYNFFLVPMQNELWNEIQGKVNCLSDAALEQIFEVASTRDKLKQGISHLQADLAKTSEQDKEFMEYAGSFSKRVEDL